MTLSIAVLAAIDMRNIGGRQDRTTSLAEGLVQLGATVDVFHRGRSESVSRNLRLIHYPGLDSVIRGSKWKEGLSQYLGPFNIASGLTLWQAARYANYDVVQLEAPHSFCPILPHLTNRPLALNAHNVEFMACRNTGRIPFLWPYVYSVELATVRNAQIILAVSKEDAAVFSDVFDFPSRRIHVVPNGVDSGKFNILTQTECKRRLGFPINSKILLFHGNYVSWANEEAALIIFERIAPTILAKEPQCLFLLVGSNPSQRMVDAAKQSDRMIVTGYVPNLDQYIMAADVCVVPLLRGAGTKLKMLEYLAAGKPIICTRVAAEGLNLVNGQEACMTPKVDTEFIDALLFLLENPRFSQELGRRARNHSKRFDWRIICQDLYKAYQQLVDTQ
jgi:glycosyltransferase involved in cell wall biosynthesis